MGLLDLGDDRLRPAVVLVVIAFASGVANDEPRRA
jgi:hypothetical protein